MEIDLDTHLTFTNLWPGVGKTVQQRNDLILYKMTCGCHHYFAFVPFFGNLVKIVCCLLIYRIYDIQINMNFCSPNQFCCSQTKRLHKICTRQGIVYSVSVNEWFSKYYLPFVSSSMDDFFEPPDWATPVVLDIDSDRCATFVHDGATFIDASFGLTFSALLPATMQSMLRCTVDSEFFSRRTKSEFIADGKCSCWNSWLLLSMGVGCQSFDVLDLNPEISDTLGGDGFTIAVGFWLNWFLRYGGISSIFIGCDDARNDALVDGLIKKIVNLVDILILIDSNFIHDLTCEKYYISNTFNSINFHWKSVESLN